MSYYVDLGLVVPLCVSWVLLHTDPLLHYFDFECYKYTQTQTQTPGLVVVPLFWLQVYTNTHTRPGCCPIICILGGTSVGGGSGKTVGPEQLFSPEPESPRFPSLHPGGTRGGHGVCTRGEEEDSPPGSNGDAVGSFENALRMQRRGIQRGKPTIVLERWR